MQTVKGKIKMYHPAQNPATGKAMKIRMRNQMICHKTLPPAAMILLFGINTNSLSLPDNRRKTTPNYAELRLADSQALRCYTLKTFQGARALNALMLEKWSSLEKITWEPMKPSANRGDEACPPYRRDCSLFPTKDAPVMITTRVLHNHLCRNSVQPDSIAFAHDLWYNMVLKICNMKWKSREKF